MPRHDFGLGQPFAEVGQQEVRHGTLLRLVVPLQPGDRVEDAVDAREVVLLVHGRRVGDVEPGDAQDRGLQQWKHRSVSRATTSAPYPPKPRGLVHHHGPPGPAHGGRHRRVVERRQRAQVDDLDVPALLERGLGRLERRRDRAAVGDQRDVPAGPPDDGLVRSAGPPADSSAVSFDQ